MHQWKAIWEPRGQILVQTRYWFNDKLVNCQLLYKYTAKYGQSHDLVVWIWDLCNIFDNQDIMFTVLTIVCWLKWYTFPDSGVESNHHHAET